MENREPESCTQTDSRAVLFAFAITGALVGLGCLGLFGLAVLARALGG